MFGGDLFDPFAKVKIYVEVKNHFSIHNWVYLLHLHWSFIFCIISCTFINCYTVLLENLPITCFGPNTDEVPKDFLDEWCWLSGTYIVPQHIDKTPGKSVPISGVGPDDTVTGSTERLYHNQYLFYPIILFLQLLTFYVSRYAWKILEGKRLKSLLSELTTAIVEPEVMKTRITLVTDYLTASPANFQNSYSYKYIFCELLNAFNVVFQFWALDHVFHQEFLGYGWDAITYLTSEGKPTITDPFTKVFPKVSLCHFTKSGPSGNPIPHEALCVLPMNNVADKLFLFWWFWLVFLGFCTVIGLIYRVILLAFPCARYFVLRLQMKSAYHNLADLKYFVDHSTYGDWFVLSLIHKNMDSWVFSNLLKELVEKKKTTGKKRL